MRYTQLLGRVQAGSGRLAAGMGLIRMGLGTTTAGLGVIGGALGAVEACFDGDVGGVLEHTFIVAQEGYHAWNQGMAFLMRLKAIAADDVGGVPGADIQRILGHGFVIVMESARIRDQTVHIQNQVGRILVQYVRILPQMTQAQ